MKRIALITSLLLASLMPTPMPAFSAVGERDTLMALYNSTNGDFWTNNTGWNTSALHCTWYGVYCDGGGNVFHLSLSNNNLSGPIPAELGSLSNLGVLNLYDNLLSGPIPAELGSLLNLGQLNLKTNQLSGSIPAELGNLSNLWLLDLSYNQLSGPIPAELSNLSSLSEFYLGENPALVCWETQEALEWALGFDFYWGPADVCNFIHLPLISR